MTALETKGRGPKEPFVPDETWIQAFETQYGADLYERMKRFARAKAKVLAFYGRVVDEYYVEELVADVVNDTLQGKARWYPERVDLRKHFLDTIRSRIRDACVHADSFPQVALEGPLGEINQEVEEAVSEAHTLDDERARIAAAAEATLDALRDLAGDDVEVVRLVDAYRTGAIGQSELLSVTGLTRLQYKAARERLGTLILQLPDHLRTDAMRIR